MHSEASCSGGSFAISSSLIRVDPNKGHLQYLHQLQADLAGEEEIEPEVVKASLSEDWLARNDAISCELGIRYPVLQAILSGRKNHQSLMVHIHYT